MNKIFSCMASMYIDLICGWINEWWVYSLTPAEIIISQWTLSVDDFTKDLFRTCQELLNSAEVVFHSQMDMAINHLQWWKAGFGIGERECERVGLAKRAFFLLRKLIDNTWGAFRLKLYMYVCACTWARACMCLCLCISYVYMCSFMSIHMYKYISCKESELMIPKVQRLGHPRWLWRLSRNLDAWGTRNVGKAHRISLVHF